ncbi:hypothetical protein AAFF_G00407490 [Aldrovandia affinis]|uniref:Gypsy retrotransposon integrase-like protein 1 n=1 Tax=Aldrovandia affinis TaxID=143900 RepID=A0AAD7R454_9TELE|nr:hypothetical protein AAFF_G00407490 [Aldrovandia affinis]
MKQFLRSKVWWPKMDDDVTTFVNNCVPCALSEKSLVPETPPLQPTPWPNGPWEKIQVDIFGELQAAPAHQKYLIVVTDLYSKWPEVIATSNVTTATVITGLSDLFTRWGQPQVIMTDNGPQFQADFTCYLEKKGISHQKTPLYHPLANAGVERFNKVLKYGLRALLQEGRQFSDALKTLLLSYRSTPHRVTGRTPAELMIGRTLRVPLDTVRPPCVTDKPPDDAKLRKEVQKRQDTPSSCRMEHSGIPEDCFVPSSLLERNWMLRCSFPNNLTMIQVNSQTSKIRDRKFPMGMCQKQEHQRSHDQLVKEDYPLDSMTLS